MKKIILLFVICMMTSHCFAKQDEPVVTITPNNISHTHFFLFTVASILTGILCGLITVCGDYYSRVFYRKSVRIFRRIAILALCIIGIITLFTLSTGTVREYGVIILGFSYVMLVSNNDKVLLLNLIASIALLQYISMVYIFQFEDFLIPFRMFIAFTISYIVFSFFEGNQKWVKFVKEKLNDFWEWGILGLFKWLVK